MEQATAMRRVWIGWLRRKWLVPLVLAVSALFLGLTLMLGVLTSVDAYLGQEESNVSADAGSGGLLTNMVFNAAVFHAAWVKNYGRGVLKVYSAAKAQLGKPYVFGANVSGANPPDFDCSGLTQWAMRKAGLSLPRTAQQQYDATKRISKSEVKAGDLIFFQGTYAGPRITHVAIVLSSTQMINAAGKDVNIATYTSSYWQSHFAGFGRIK